jgi:hydroxypyruvate isomerase
LPPPEPPPPPLADLDAAADLVNRLRRSGAGNVGILLDVYHLARMKHYATADDLAAAIRRYVPEALHVQLADLAARQCPGTGELDFAGIHEALASAGYRCFIGLGFTSA